MLNSSQKYILWQLSLWSDKLKHLKFVAIEKRARPVKRNVIHTTVEFDIEHQIKLLNNGTQYVKLLRPATIDGGIFKLSGSTLKSAIERYQQEKDSNRVVKFVPASGAASRMFKRIYQWIDDSESHRKEINAFFRQVEELAFFEEWVSAADKADLETFESGLPSKVKWLHLLVDENGLGLASLPKGLISFHHYDAPQTPIAEHLKEAMAYATQNGTGRIHFTVSPEHLDLFNQEVETLIEQDPFSQIEWEITYSQQDPSSNTIALDNNGKVLEQGGSPLQRPGGHGSLIQNLNQLDADLVFIKNIDNVVHDRLLKQTVDYKMALGGILLDLRADLKYLYNDLAKGLVDELTINELRDKWKIRIPRDYQKLKAYLARPIRVCGMVKNQGEPGGGPFWSLDPFTGESLQIIEQAQIDPTDSRQQNIAQTATHFNPVDLACYITNFKGQKIELTNYINADQYFVTQKSSQGMLIKSLEWPGLWNGAMAHWITIFVEVPVSTFNPVKEVSDLLRENHLKSRDKVV